MFALMMLGQLCRKLDENSEILGQQREEIGSLRGMSTQSRMRSEVRLRSGFASLGLVIQLSHATAWSAVEPAAGRCNPDHSSVYHRPQL